MPEFRPIPNKRVLMAMVLAGMALPAVAQRHSGITSPPTAPPPAQAAAPAATPIVAVSSGMGPLQFVEASSPEPAPESLARQLQAEDERIRAAALAAIGAPAPYLVRDRAPMPHSVRVDYVALGNSGELDAILTAELDLHLVSAVLAPFGNGWRRVATLTYATAFADPATNSGTFLQTTRSLMGMDHYTAVFHSRSVTPDGDVTEHEAYLSLIRGHAVMTISFVSHQRVCEAAHLQAHTPHNECEVTDRWVQPAAADEPTRVTVVTATGRTSAHELLSGTPEPRLFDLAGQRTYECQAFEFSDTSSRYEPVEANGPCAAH
jgi:hypothetical protein